MALTTPPSAFVCRRMPPAPARRGADHTVSLRSEYDLSPIAGLTRIIAWATVRDDADLVLDLSRVRFMDAATNGVIVRASNGLQSASHSSRLRCPSVARRRRP